MMRHPSSMRLILRFMSRYPWRVTAGLAMGVTGTLLAYVFPALTQWFLDDIIPNRDTSRIVQLSAIGLGAMFLKQLFFSLRTLANNAFELRMTYDLRSRLHEKIQHLPLKWFDRQSTGDIITRMADDVPATQRVILDGIDQGVPAVLQLVLTAGVMFWLDSKLAMVVLIPVPFIAAGGWIYARWVSPRALEARKAAGGLNSLLHDNIAGIRQIKSYTLEEEKQRGFNASSSEYRRQQTRLQRAWSVYGPGMGFLGDTGVILLMGFGAWWCIQDAVAVPPPPAAETLTIGKLAQFLLLMGMFYEPVGRLHGINQTVVTGLAAAQRVFEILELEGTEDLKKGERLGEVRGEIEFKNVSFRYDENRPIVTDINVVVRARQTVAFVGATGAGKSTLFQLLTRFYEANEGGITLDGHLIQDVNKADLRDAIGYVTQESYLFNQSIRENLLLGRPTATDEELWEALRQACASEFVERMDGGLDAMVGERGSRLSGGEKQRISIARAFLKNAPILLLDEATSAVDTRSEKLIQRAIDGLRTNRTCLVIAHRLSTILHADRIYAMRNGQILAHGTHAELLQTSEYYAELVKLSFQEEKMQG
ncbi:ABC transporter ATP-binding protein [Verrucomicrobium spinosum]|uniref:ABC transporter ATP-binding protein n=1 Tax=Verrucomicrobium spinosum TaxID=2736 RepID=UPI0001744B3B|nr:ABC transporter ATP-binding protein [Verrucomicrobium spinosum]